MIIIAAAVWEKQKRDETIDKFLDLSGKSSFKLYIIKLQKKKKNTTRKIENRSQRCAADSITHTHTTTRLINQPKKKGVLSPFCPLPTL